MTILAGLTLSAAIFCCLVLCLAVNGSSSTTSDHDFNNNILNEDLYAEWNLNHSSRLNTYGGDWLKAPANICEASPVCIDDKHFGQISWQPVVSFTNQSACQRINDLKIKRIYFVGDSFIRHIYQAFLLLFSGDYESGSLNNKQLSRCKGNAQFAEKVCSGITAVSKLYRSACYGEQKIDLAFLDVFNFKFTPDKFPLSDSESLLIWSEGSHPPLFNYTADGRNVRIVFIMYIICIKMRTLCV